MDPVLVQPVGCPKSVLAADRDQAVETVFGQCLAHLLDSILALVDVRARAAENRAAAVQDAAGRIERQRDREVVERAFPAIPEADDLIIVGLDPLTNDCPDDCIQAGAIATAGEDPDPHRAVMLRAMAVSWRSDGLKRTLPLFGGIGASGLALTGLAALEVRHCRALESDDEWAALCSPLVGRGAQVTSPDGTLLGAAVLGDGDRPTVVLAPGWTEEVRIWGPVARGLVERGFKVVVYDLRGQGASGQAGSGDYTLARYGEDLDAILAFAAEETGAGPEDLIVAGHSLGAMSVVAWAIAHRPRSRVRAAALINAAVAGVISESRIVPGQFPGAVKQWLGMNLVLNNRMPRLAVSTAVSRAVLRRAA